MFRQTLLRGCAAHCALVEDPAAVRADVLLDLVGDPGVLTQRVRDHSFVLVELAGSSSVPRGHLASQTTVCALCHKYLKGKNLQQFNLDQRPVKPGATVLSCVPCS